MILKSKQLKAEEIKTTSISKLVKLRLKTLKPYKGVIEIINTADQGRVCALKISDFCSRGDADIYAELLRLAPELLYFYLTDSGRIEQALLKLEKRLDTVQAKRKKKLKTKRTPTIKRQNTLEK